MPDAALVSQRSDVHAATLGALVFDNPERMKRDAIFQVGSTTTLIIAVAAMVLVEECNPAVSKDGNLVSTVKRYVLFFRGRRASFMRAPLPAFFKNFEVPELSGRFRQSLQGGEKALPPNQQSHQATNNRPSIVRSTRKPSTKRLIRSPRADSACLAHTAAASFSFTSDAV